jgi:hypothetical protein
MNQLELLCSSSPSSSSTTTTSSVAPGDADALRLLASSRGELRELMASAETAAKRAVVELSRAVASEAAAAADLASPLDQLRAQCEALDAARARVQLELQGLQRARDASAASIQRLLGATLHYKELLRALQADAAASVPRTRHFLTLYAIISAVKWDYEGEGTGAMSGAAAEGYIAPPGGAPVRPFRFDVNLAPARLADELWGAIGEAHGLGSG